MGLYRPSGTEFDDLVRFRHALHRRPDLSGSEHATAETITAEMVRLGADRIVTGLGGTGVAAVFDGARPGPVVMLRAELDGLPITETGTIAHRSEKPGHGHLCGHDGHMTILVAVARRLAEKRPARGRAMLLFQPAEETGAGAAAVIADPRWPSMRPDYALALHNMPGEALGTATLDSGIVNCASRGLAIRLEGRTAHASMPETGHSPLAAATALAAALQALSSGHFPDPGFRLATLTHLKVGEPAFGVAPGDADIFVTLRTVHDASMEGMVSEARALAEATAARHGLGLSMTEADIFAHCENDPRAVAILEGAMVAAGVPCRAAGKPFRASEDFGRFGKDGIAAAMLYLGAGTDLPALHNPDYDFPDALIGTGAAIFSAALDGLLG